MHFFAFFFSTLITHYSFNLGFAPFVLISLFLFLLLTFKQFFNYQNIIKKKLSFPLLLLPIFLWGLLVSFFSFYPFLVSRLIVFLYIPIIILYFDIERKRNFHYLKFSVYLSLIIHLIAFFYQAFFFYTTNEIIDFVQPITGEASRVIGGSYEPIFGQRFARLSGLFTEPGTYVSVIFTMFLFYKIICSKTCGLISNKFSLLELFVLSSVFLSFSTFGYIFLLIYVFMNFFRVDFLKIIYFFIFLVISVLLSYEYFFDRFLSQDQYLDDYRLEVIINFFSVQFDFSKLIFGYGYFTDFRKNIFYVIEDVGFLFNILFYFGIFGFIYFLFLIINRWKFLSIMERTLLMCLFLSKLTFTYIFFLFYLCFIFSKSINKSNLHKFDV